MKRAIFPGSFNPWHDGHQEVLDKALKIFDEVVVCQLVNPEKEYENNDIAGSLVIHRHTGLLRDFVSSAYLLGEPFCAIVKGIRNSHDFEYEKIQQYQNEDLGVEIPVVYFFSSRHMVHKSSTAIRNIQYFGVK